MLHVFETKEKLLPKTETFYPSFSVDRKHLMRFQSGNAVFKILLRSVDGAVENMECF